MAKLNGIWGSFSATYGGAVEQQLPLLDAADTKDSLIENADMLPLICDEYSELNNIRVLKQAGMWSIVDKKFNIIEQLKASDDVTITKMGNYIGILHGFTDSFIYTLGDMESDYKVCKCNTSEIREISPDILILKGIYNSNIGRHDQIVYKGAEILPEIYSSAAVNKIYDDSLVLWLRDANKHEGFTTKFDLKTMKLDVYSILNTQNEMVNGVCTEYTGEKITKYAVRINYNTLTDQLYTDIEAYPELRKFNLIGVKVGDDAGYIDYAGNVVVDTRWKHCGYTGYKGYFIVGNGTRGIKFGIYDAFTKQCLIEGCDSYSVHPKLNFNYFGKNGVTYILGDDGIYDSLATAFKKLYRYKKKEGIFAVSIYNRWNIIDNTYTPIKLNVSDLSTDSSDWEQVVW